MERNGFNISTIMYECNTTILHKPSTPLIEHKVQKINMFLAACQMGWSNLATNKKKRKKYSPRSILAAPTNKNKHYDGLKINIFRFSDIVSIAIFSRLAAKKFKRKIEAWTLLFMSRSSDVHPLTFVIVMMCTQDRWLRSNILSIYFRNCLQLLSAIESWQAIYVIYTYICNYSIWYLSFKIFMSHFYTQTIFFD